jgi:signal transduction histidine kinase
MQPTALSQSGKANGLASLTGSPIAATPLAGAPERSARANRMISALGEMTGGITHDFRNILCIVASGLRVAERNIGKPARLKAALDAIQEGVERGLRMTSRILAFSNQQEFACEQKDVSSLLRELEVFLKYGAGSGIHVTLNLEPDLPNCPVDAARFNAAMINMVANARDAMPAGGDICISAVHVPGDRFDYVRVRVRDSGVGIPPEVMSRIFEPFFTTKGEKGTGLGVPQIQAMMHRAGGCLRIDSKLGEGSTFDLFFPVAKLPTIDERQLERWANEGGAIYADQRGPPPELSGR